MSSATRSEGKRNHTNNALAYSLTGAPPAVRCAWCERQFDGTDERLTGRVRCARLRRGYDVAMAER